MDRELTKFLRDAVERSNRAVRAVVVPQAMASGDAMAAAAALSLLFRRRLDGSGMTGGAGGATDGHP
jgi:nanoRNase/pAp phosphatase (c-di-AMP/oligoRNAs hydrolase)